MILGLQESYIPTASETIATQLPFEIVVIQTCPAEPVAKTAFKPRARAALWNTVAGCAL